MNLREEVSQIIGLLIPPHSWRIKMAEASMSGKLDEKKVINILITLCEHVEKLEPQEEVRQSAPITKHISLYNPMDEDFTVGYDTKGDKNVEYFTIHSREIESFELPLGDHLLKHLVDFVAERRKVPMANYEELETIKKQVVVTL